MDCYRVRRSLAGYFDNAVSSGLRQEILAHLARCRACASLSQQYLQARSALRALPKLEPPKGLIYSLRVLASRERERLLAGSPWRALLAPWLVRGRLWTEGMMRPVALPIAGGLVSALILFALVMPGVSPMHSSLTGDVPTMLSTEPIFVGMGPFGFTEDEVTVDLTVDRQGRFVDYSIPGGQAWVKNPGARRVVENALLFTQFAPGTTFGQPAKSKVRITLRRSRIDVRG